MGTFVRIINEQEEADKDKIEPKVCGDCGKEIREGSHYLRFQGSRYPFMCSDCFVSKIYELQETGEMELSPMTEKGHLRIKRFEDKGWGWGNQTQLASFAEGRGGRRYWTTFQIRKK